MKYDINIKKAVFDDYFNNGLSYRKISQKYSINKMSVCRWIKNKDILLDNNKSIFIDVTNKVKKPNDLFNVQINRFSFVIDYEGLKAIIGAIKDDRLN